MDPAATNIRIPDLPGPYKNGRVKQKKRICNNGKGKEGAKLFRWNDEACKNRVWSSQKPLVCRKKHVLDKIYKSEGEKSIIFTDGGMVLRSRRHNPSCVACLKCKS